jgi:ribonucleoside-diphosphate reductase beta chain
MWKQQHQVHWMPDEVPMAGDISDWKDKLTDAERGLLTQIFRFFTQADVEVGDCYHRHYLNVFQPTEVKMMLTAFSDMETIHMAAYSHLLDSLKMPEDTYRQFLDYEVMVEKYDYMQGFRHDDPLSVAETMAVFAGFTEGLQLFASFAILLNFPRHNKMKGMGQIIAWSVRDESLHCEGVSKLFRTWVEEKLDARDCERLKARIYEHLEHIIHIEDKFIDLAFSGGEIDGLTPQEVKDYIRYIANMRLQQLSVPGLLQLEPVYPVFENPIPWIVEQLNGLEFVNFFENRATDYAKGATRGEWHDVWDDVDGAKAAE